MTVARVQGLTYAFGDHRMLEISSLTVAPGERLVVFGPNGSGKTTLLRLLAGTLRGAAGIIDAAESAYLPQRPYLFRGSARWNLLLGIHPDEHGRAIGLAGDFGLTGKLDHPARALSGGERQRLALARLLAGTEPLALLDEPLAAVDHQDRMSVARTLAAELGDRGVVTVTHDREEAAVLADTVTVLVDGVQRQTGPIEEIFSLPADDVVAGVVGLGNAIAGSIIEISGPLAALQAGPIVVWGLADDAEEGMKARALFGAEAVTVYARDTASAGSARNAWRGRVVEVRPAGRLIELLVDVGVTIAALVTPGSFEAMSPAPGDELLLAVKATGVRLVAG